MSNASYRSYASRSQWDRILSSSAEWVAPVPYPMHMIPGAAPNCHHARGSPCHTYAASKDEIATSWQGASTVLELFNNAVKKYGKQK